MSVFRIRLSKKLILLLLPLFLVGWGFYVVGLISAPNTSLSFFSPHFLVLVSGPFIVKVGLFHAVLSGTAGSVSGAILAVQTTVHFSAVGAVTHTCMAAAASAMSEEMSAAGQTTSKLMMLGVALQVLSWCQVMLCSSIHEHKFDESSGQAVGHSNKYCCHEKSVKFVSLICLLLSAISWCVLCIGATLTTIETALDPDQQSSILILFPFLLAHLLAMLHLTTKNNKLVTFSFSILNMAYLLFMGNTIYNTVLARRECRSDQIECTPQYMHASRVILIGGLSCLIFWGCSYALWPFIRKHRQPQCGQQWSKAKTSSAGGLRSRTTA